MIREQTGLSRGVQLRLSANRLPLEQFELLRSNLIENYEKGTYLKEPLPSKDAAVEPSLPPMDGMLDMIKKQAVSFVPQVRHFSSFISTEAFRHFSSFLSTAAPFDKSVLPSYSLWLIVCSPSSELIELIDSLIVDNFNVLHRIFLRWVHPQCVETLAASWKDY